MKLITAATLVSLAALSEDATASPLAISGPKIVRNVFTKISLSPRFKFSAEGHSGSLDLCEQDSPFESHSSHDTGHNHDDCMESTCDMYAEHGDDLESAEEALDTCEVTTDETPSSTTLFVDFRTCMGTSVYETACTDAANGQVLTADMDITCMVDDNVGNQAHPNLKMGHTSDDTDYQIIFDLEGVPGCFGSACLYTADPAEADVAEFEKIVAHEIMEEFEKYLEEETGEQVPIHCQGARGEIHNSHDHDSHDHGSHDHGSHDHGSHDHGSHDHGSHDHGNHGHTELLRGIVKSS